jgi:uncharacterized FlgJ-related protein
VVFCKRRKRIFDSVFQRRLGGESKVDGVTKTSDESGWLASRLARDNLFGGKVLYLLLLCTFL